MPRLLTSKQARSLSNPLPALTLPPSLFSAPRISKQGDWLLRARTFSSLDYFVPHKQTPLNTVYKQASRLGWRSRCVVLSACPREGFPQLFSIVSCFCHYFGEINFETCSPSIAPPVSTRGLHSHFEIGVPGHHLTNSQTIARFVHGSLAESYREDKK